MLKTYLGRILRLRSVYKYKGHITG